MGQLSEAERAQLHPLIGGGTAPARMLTRARIWLQANAGEAGPAWTDAAIAGALAGPPTTVARVREPAVTEGLEAARERKRPDRVYGRKLDGEPEARLLALTCSPPPAGQQRWTLRLLAERLVQWAVVDTIAHEPVRQT